MFDIALLHSLAFVGAAAVLTVTPGVDTALVLRSAASGGKHAGAAAGLGIAAGLLLWGAAAALGLSALLNGWPLGFVALQWAGAAYLMFLGVKLIINAGRAKAAQTDRGAAAFSGKFFRRGFLTNVLNPKVGAFYATFLPQFIPHGVDAAAFSLFLAAIHVVLTTLWFALLIGLTVPLTRVLERPRVARVLDRLTGGVFIAFGVRLAIMQRI